MDGLAEQRRGLLDRAHRAGIHRMNGLCQLLGNLCQLGGAEAGDSRPSAWMDEYQTLAADQRRLWECMQRPGLDPLLVGRIPESLLAAALRMGTPAEAGDALPHIDQPLAAVALALWLEDVGGNCGQLQHALHFRSDGRLRVRVQGGAVRLPAEPLLYIRFAGHLEAEADLDSLFGFDAGVLVRGLSPAPKPSEPEVVPRQAASS